MCCGVLSSDWVRHLHCSTPSCIVHSPFSLCVCCHSIVGLGSCLCDRVMSLWNSGGGLCWVEGRGCLPSTHHPCCGAHFSGVRVVMAVCDDSACFVLSYCVVGCGMAVCGGGVVSLLVFIPPFLSLFLSFSSPLSLRVGVRGSARAALRARTLSPNTIVFPLAAFVLLFSFSSRPAFLRAPPFLFVGMAVCGHHVSVCLVGMTAMGSLSLSSSFFW